MQIKVIFTIKVVHLESEGFWNSEVVAYCDVALRRTRFHAYVISVYWLSLILPSVEKTD